jgi:hypothetical protein
MATTKFVPTATISKVTKGHFEVVVKKSFMAKNVKIDKRFKSITKAQDWCLKNGYTNIEHV